MTWEIELTLNTNIKRFETWFDGYRLSTLFALDFNPENNKYLLVINAPTFERELHGVRVHEIKAMIGEPLPDDSKDMVTTLPFPVIQLELFEPAENRINVKISCLHDSLQVYFINMLGEIAKLWPEAIIPVLNFNNQYLPEEDKALSVSVDQNAGRDFTTYREEFILSCNKREFRVWLEHQYPAHAKYYRDTPEGATFSINLTQFTFAYLSDNGQYKYIFTVTEPDGLSKIREDFISTMCNTFKISKAQDIENETNNFPQNKPGRPSNPAHDWAYQQIFDGIPQNKVYPEWKAMYGEINLLSDPKDTFKSMIAYRRRKERKR